LIMEYLKELGTLLEVKICDLRELLYIQSETAVDRGIHLGGSQSAIVPLAALYYGGQFRYNLKHPTTDEQDIFILSKGHAVAALASVYSDVGYLSEDDLHNSRGWNAKVKGHPGLSIPGVQTATGPLGHGIGIACGFAFRQREMGEFNTYTLVGDGELQEGSCWESLMFAATNKLNNLCVIVDKNNGQSDDVRSLFLPLNNLDERFEAFGFNVYNTDAGNISEFLSCLEAFNEYPKNSKPTVIICEGYKGFGGYSSNSYKHKATIPAEEIEMERKLLSRRRETLIKSLNGMNLSAIEAYSENLGFDVCYENGAVSKISKAPKTTSVKRAKPRDKVLEYNAKKLPRTPKGESLAPTDLATTFASVFAEDKNFYTIDADLSNVSGLYTGTALTNRFHAINTGISECNMMNMAEGLAIMGANVWVSTFGPFFNLQAFRRICVSYQERIEEIESRDGWLSEGHNLDITFLSTASNIDTGVNGATHMSNDDINIFGQLAHVKVIDACCPQQFLAVAKWVAEGNRGLVYLRMLRYGSPALYDYDYHFEFGRGNYLYGNDNSDVVIVSSGHGVLEALSAAELLKSDGVYVAVIDMPSYDSELLKALAEKGKVIIFAEQNNGWLFDNFCRDSMQNHFVFDNKKIHQICVLDEKNSPQFIQSGTYEQLTEVLGLSPERIRAQVRGFVSDGT